MPTRTRISKTSVKQAGAADREAAWATRVASLADRGARKDAIAPAADRDWATKVAAAGRRKG